MAEDQVDQTKQKPAKKKTSPLKIALIILTLLIALLILKFILIITAKPTISFNYVAELNRISKPTNYDANQDAAPLYLEVIREFSEVPHPFTVKLATWPTALDTNDLEIIANWLAAKDETLKYIEQVASKPYCWSAKTSQLSRCSSYLLNIGRAFCLRSVLTVYKGQCDKAIIDLITCYRIGRHLTGPKTILEQLTGTIIKAYAITTAFEILSKAPLDAQTMTLFQKQLEEDIDKNPTSFDLQLKKLACDYTIENSFSDDGRGNGHLIPRLSFVYYTDVFPDGRIVEERQLDKKFLVKYINDVWWAATGPGKKETLNLAEEYFSYLAKIADQTPWQTYTDTTDNGEKLKEQLVVHYFLRWDDKTIKYIEKVHSLKTREIGLIATLAILRYKIDQGQLPETLDQLVSTGYLKQLPMDPYSDSVLVYKLIGDDFMLYSLGADFDDDGGVYSDWGKSLGGGDQVFWPVKRQRKKRDNNAHKALFPTDIYVLQRTRQKIEKRRLR